jgi:DNA repair protein RecO (recombination protein O)
MFEFISQKLQSLDQLVKIPADYLLRFLLELSSLLGFYPNGEYNESAAYFDLQEGNFVSDISTHPYSLMPPHSEYLSMLLHINGTEIPTANRRKLLDGLLQYYQLHVPNFTLPKSLKVLDEVFHS